jgi:hypothetical protein
LPSAASSPSTTPARPDTRVSITVTRVPWANSSALLPMGSGAQASGMVISQRMAIISSAEASIVALLLRWRDQWAGQIDRKREARESSKELAPTTKKRAQRPQPPQWKSPSPGPGARAGAASHHLQRMSSLNHFFEIAA